MSLLSCVLLVGAYLLGLGWMISAAASFFYTSVEKIGFIEPTTKRVKIILWCHLPLMVLGIILTCWLATNGYLDPANYYPRPVQVEVSK